MEYRYVESPIGKLLLVGEGETVHQIGFPSHKGKVTPEDSWHSNQQVLTRLVSQLEAYFAGKLQKFDLELCPDGTQFQLQVLAALQHIPYGDTRSYADIAREIGRPKAVRAVGAANGRNPIPIVIPCHRVIGSNGSLTGFGGGLGTKQFLLNLESGSRDLF